MRGRRVLALVPAGIGHPLPDPDRAGDVLDLLQAEIGERLRYTVLGYLVHDIRDADRAGFGNRFQPGGDIDRVAENIPVFQDDIADIDADAILDALLAGGILLALLHRLLDLQGAAHGRLRRIEARQHAVACGLDDLAAGLRDGRVDQLAPMELLTVQNICFVALHQAAVACHVGGQNGAETTLHDPIPR